jgi:peptide/nickel transport system permease protein
MKRYVQIADDGAGSLRPAWRSADTLHLVYVGYGLLIVLLVLASYALGILQWLPHDPEQIRFDLLNAPPGSPGHLLGTDFLGRDILSRLIVAIQAYFLPGLVAIVISVVAGTFLGALAGYRGGGVEVVIVYVNNLVDSFPRLVLILLVIAVFKADIYYIMIVVGVTGVPVVASLVAGKIAFLRQKHFIEAAHVLGLPSYVIVLKHILWHHCAPLLVIRSTIGMGEAILIETSLSYLGFGVQEPVASWGNMVQAGANYFFQGKFWPSTAPALAILFTILGFHLLGDGLNGILEDRGGK